MTVHVLTIDTRYGIDAWAFTTLEAADRALDRYVVQNWGDGPMPEDRDERVEEYFDCNDREDYNILILEVEE